jgi:hypothetical protein
MEEITSQEFFEKIVPVHSHNTIKSLFNRVEFEDTVKLINDIPELEKISLKKYNNKVHTLLWAVQCDKLHVVKWICEHDFEKPTQFTLEIAAKRGHLEIFIWLMKNTNLECNQRVIDIAACNGQFKVVKWIYQNTDIKATQQTLDWVNEEGFYTLANWLKENTPSLNEYIRFDNSGDLYQYFKKNITLFYK